MQNRLAEWRRLLRSSTTQARTVMQRILRGRLICTPHVDPITDDVTGYDFTAPTRFDRLFTGLAVERPALPKEMNVAEQYDPEETFDAGYGRLLERAYEGNVEVLASPTGTEARWQLHVDGFSDLKAA